MSGPFWQIERLPDEDTRTFVIRSWGEIFKGLTPDELAAIPFDQSGAEVVRRGYQSPYTFGHTLRKMAGDKNAAILAAYRQGQPPVYYTWGMFADDGPHLAVLYDPALREGTIWQEIDFFDALGFIADTSPSESELG